MKAAPGAPFANRADWSIITYNARLYLLFMQRQDADGAKRKSFAPILTSACDFRGIHACRCSQTRRLTDAQYTVTVFRHSARATLGTRPTKNRRRVSTEGNRRGFMAVFPAGMCLA